MPTLSIQLPGLPPVSHVLKDETITIGRMKGNTIVIEDSSISLVHAKITRKDGEYFLKDLNSTNGTILNGQPLGEAKLRDMDRVRFAEITAQFVADAGAPAPVPVAQPLPGSALPPQPVATAPQVAAAFQIPTGPIPPASAPVLRIATSAVSPPASTSSLPAAAPGSARRSSKNRNAVRALAVAAVAVIVLFGLGGWMFFHGREGAGKLASRAPSPQNAARSRADNSSGPRSAGVPVKPVLETDSPGTIPTVAQWARALKSSDAAERRQAATSLHSAGTEARAAIPELRAALRDSDRD